MIESYIEERLFKKQQLCNVLKDYSPLATEEVSSILGISEKNVKGLIE